ncbi:MAG: hypothetical protein IIW19_04360, partial [Clostridia bacterium]|nr:hypothetical protein [Clostridia bacterium]
MKKFIIMAVSLLLTALLALVGCMYAIGENKAESKPYDMGETVSVAPEDTPEAQKEMEKKFSVYNHVTEENGKKILTLFSEEQAEEQWMKRKNGEEFRLTYDEILFIISDSQRLYETYDEIILPDAEVSNAAADAIGGSPLFGLARTIRPSPAEAAALTFHGETEHFALRMREITDIIVYRLWMLDSRMRKGYRVWQCASGIYAESVSLLFEDEVTKLTEGSSAPPTGCIWTLIPDDLDWESEGNLL